MPNKLDEIIAADPKLQAIPRERVFEHFYKKYYEGKLSREELRARINEPDPNAPPQEPGKPTGPTQDIPRQSWGDVAGRAIENLAPSAYKNFIEAPYEFAKTAVTDPELAAGAVFSPIAGAVRQIPGLEASPDDPMGQQSEATFKALKDAYVQKYGTLEGFKEALASDPASIMADAAVVMPGVGAAVGAPLRAAGVAAKMPPLLRTAGKVITSPVGETIGAGVRHLGNAPMYFSGPKTRARASILDVAEGVPDPQSDLLALGPDAVLGDVLGSEGRRHARAAGNINPQAGDILEEFSTRRAEGRPDRLLSAEEDARAAHGPRINEAYRIAKAQGADLPKTTITGPAPGPHSAFMNPVTTATNIPAGFEDLISSPLYRPFWNKAEKLVAELERKEPQGDFARLEKFRSELNTAAHKAKDPTQELAFQEGVREIDRLMEEANISPGREAARATHKAMKADVDLAKEEAKRRERRFGRFEKAITGNSTTAEQTFSMKNILERANIIGDVVRGNYASATAKVTGLLMGKGLEKGEAQALALQLLEEAKLLVGKEFPTRPAASRIQQGGQLLGDAAAYGTLLGGKLEAETGLLTRGGVR